jgi:hypothetical protein
MFKDARPTQNDEFYLVTDTEGNIGIICFWNLIEVTDPELLQKKKLILKVTNSYIAFKNFLKKHGQTKPYKVFGILCAL